MPSKPAQPAQPAQPARPDRPADPSRPRAAAAALEFRPQGDSAIRIGWSTAAEIGADAAQDSAQDPAQDPAEDSAQDPAEDPGARLADAHELDARLRAGLAAAAQHPHADSDRTLTGLIEIVPGYASVTVFYRPTVLAYGDLCATLRDWAGQPPPNTTVAPREIVLPTVYGGEAGPDLAAVAEHAGLTVEAVVQRHSQARYTVAMIGFQPGFPYLTGLPPALQMPRLATPRLIVPAGSVAIGGAQAGVYPFASPGGWRLIGRTAVTLFDSTRDEPCLCRAGDRVRFQPLGAGGLAHG